MTDDTLMLNRDTLRESLHEWQIEQDALDAEWNESLSALAALQSHLDAWHHDLADQRDALRGDQEALRKERTAIDRDRESLADDRESLVHDREALAEQREALAEEREALVHDRQVLAVERDTFERERASAVANQDKASAHTTAQLAEAREKVALLSEQLLTRTEELRQLDQKRAALATELEVARATAKQLAAESEQQRKSVEIERSAWTDQLQHLRELLEQRAAAPITGYDYNDVGTSSSAEPAPPTPPRPAKTAAGEKPSTNNPVLGSIMEQFGKLRQQRATDRQAGKLPR